MVARLSPIDARAAEIIRGASSVVPAQPAETEVTQADGVVANPTAGF